MEELKMYLAVRTDIGLENHLGKAMAQAGHGFASCLLDAYKLDSSLVDRYQEANMPKIIVRVENETKLKRVYAEAVTAGLSCHYVVDAGRTVFAEPTATVVCFGPCLRSQLPPFLGRLRIL